MRRVVVLFIQLITVERFQMEAYPFHLKFKYILWKRKDEEEEKTVYK